MTDAEGLRDAALALPLEVQVDLIAMCHFRRVGPEGIDRLRAGGLCGNPGHRLTDHALHLAAVLNEERRRGGALGALLGTGHNPEFTA